MKVIVFVFLMLLGSFVFAENGPLNSKLKPSKIYNDGGSSYYIEFNSGSMPGCYSDKGGRLKSTNPLFKETYSTVLTMMAIGGIRGHVVFNVTGTDGSWSECEIVGFDLKPMQN